MAFDVDPEAVAVVMDYGAGWLPDELTAVSNYATTAYQVTAPNFVAGFDCEDGWVVRYAPILSKWVAGKSEAAACLALGRFKIEVVSVSVLC